MSIKSRLAEIDRSPFPDIATVDSFACIHCHSGLCPSCQAEYDDDPTAWADYGEHSQGIANRQALFDELKSNPSRSPQYGDDVPL